MIDEIYLCQHCHTDIGYTHEQPTLWDLQRRFIAAALEYGEPDPGDPATLRWTIETTFPLLEWLETATQGRIERFKELEEAGTIEVTAMPFNGSPLLGPAEYDEALRPLEVLREEYGVSITHGMNCDVNGQNWSLVDCLRDAGVETFSMAINEHFGGAPMQRPNVFRWESPSGESLPTVNGYHYGIGKFLGIGNDVEAFRTEWCPRLLDHLDTVDWPLDIAFVQTTHPFGDNAPPHTAIAEFVREWNDVANDEDLPTIRIATPSQFWEAVGEDLDSLPTYSGDWPDFWTFGVGSSAREVAINRDSRRRLKTTDALMAGLNALGEPLADQPPTRRPRDGSRAEAWWNLLTFGEHSWGSDTSVRRPASEDARTMWYHKAKYAYEARSMSRMIRRDAVAELGRRVGGDER